MSKSKVKKSSKVTKSSSKTKKCTKRVQKQIRKNMHIYEKSKKTIKSRDMAIAMAYGKVKSKYPRCQQHLKKKKRKKKP